MKVTIIVAGDVGEGENKRAVHAGQHYELPDDVAKALIASGKAEKYKAPSAPKAEAAEDKQAAEAPENKAPKRRDSRRSTIQRSGGSR